MEIILFTPAVIIYETLLPRVCIFRCHLMWPTLGHAHADFHSRFIDQQGACVKKLSGKAKLEDSKATKQVVALLSAPLEKYSDIVTALTLSNYPRVMDHLDDGTNKVMAMVIIQSIMTNNTCISTADKVSFVFVSF